MRWRGNGCGADKPRAPKGCRQHWKLRERPRAPCESLQREFYFSRPLNFGWLASRTRGTALLPFKARGWRPAGPLMEGDEGGQAASRAHTALKNEQVGTLSVPGWRA